MLLLLSAAVSSSATLTWRTAYKNELMDLISRALRSVESFRHLAEEHHHLTQQQQQQAHLPPEDVLRSDRGRCSCPPSWRPGGRKCLQDCRRAQRVTQARQVLLSSVAPGENRGKLTSAVESGSAASLTFDRAERRMEVKAAFHLRTNLLHGPTLLFLNNRCEVRIYY